MVVKPEPQSHTRACKIESPKKDCESFLGSTIYLLVYIRQRAQLIMILRIYVIVARLQKFWCSKILKIKILRCGGVTLNRCRTYTIIKKFLRLICVFFSKIYKIFYNFSVCFLKISGLNIIIIFLFGSLLAAIVLLISRYLLMKEIKK